MDSGINQNISRHSRIYQSSTWKLACIFLKNKCARIYHHKSLYICSVGCFKVCDVSFCCISNVSFRFFCNRKNDFLNRRTWDMDLSPLLFYFKSWVLIGIKSLDLHFIHWNDLRILFYLNESKQCTLKVNTVLSNC